MRHLTRGDFRRTAWKNGGGETLELAVFPPGADLEDFAWRISMARIERDGPFSPFPGVDRTILVQSGAGMALDVDGLETTLGLGDQPFRFAGDSQTTCRLLAGPVTDINIMSRRSVCSHTVSRIGANITITGETQTLVLASTPLSVDALFDKIDQGDLLVFEPGESLTVTDGHALAIHFSNSGA
jgi:environmental stress-induced protein Ves